MSTIAQAVQASPRDCAWMVWSITLVGNRAGAPTYIFNADALLK
jgi:hypothetical protein